jgi:putative transposase
MTRRRYDTDLTDAQWHLIAPLLPPAKPGGRPRSVDLREVVNGILYVTRSGCQWRLVPHDLPPWGTLHYYYWRWRKEGVWPRVHDTLRDKLRQREGREQSPSAAIVDSQSVKTTEKGAQEAMTAARR